MLGLPVLGPHVDEDLSDKHADGTSCHAKGNADEDGHESDFERRQHNVTHTVEEMLLVMTGVAVVLEKSRAELLRC